MVLSQTPLPDYLTADQIADLGVDPTNLLQAGVEPVTGHGGVPCWPVDTVRDWLGRDAA